MEKDTFEQLFRGRLEARLTRYGFCFHGRRLVMKDDLNTIALIRLGGRGAVEGAITHVLCFRHSFLRDLKETTPTAAPENPHDYPYKFRPSDILREAPLSYSPHNRNYPKDRYHFSVYEEAVASGWIEGLADMIEGAILPWVASLNPAAAQAEIKRLGNGDWCEQLWNEDYEAWLSGRP